MISKLKTAALSSAAAIAMMASPAHAVELLFTLKGLSADKFNASFVLDTTRAPSTVLSTSIRYNGVPITYTLPNSTTPITENGMFTGPTFQTLGNQGGFFFGRLNQATNFNNRIQIFGPQLFTGPTSAPIFSTGVFDLSDISRQRTTDPLIVNYRLTISEVTAAVPEPATWAMMIMGFGLIGGAMRSRQSKLSVRFAR